MHIRLWLRPPTVHWPDFPSIRSHTPLQAKPKRGVEFWLPCEPPPKERAILYSDGSGCHWDGRDWDQTINIPLVNQLGLGPRSGGRIRSAQTNKSSSNGTAWEEKTYQWAKMSKGHKKELPFCSLLPTSDKIMPENYCQLIRKPAWSRLR